MAAMIRLSLFVLFFSSLVCPLVRAEIRVLVTIKPVHSLVAAVMGETGEPELLIDGAESPHGFHLKPSEAKLLYGADMVFYIDPDFETFLAKPLESASFEGEAMALSQATGVVIKSWHHEHEHHGHEAHECSARDLHLWLSLENTQAMVDAIAAKLSSMQPQHEAVYAANAEKLKTAIHELDAELESRLSEVKGRPYLVFHDAYRYFESRYGLANVGVIAKQPGVPLSARQMKRIEGLIESEGVVCVFAEPQFSDKTVSTIAEETGLKQGELDPLGASLEPGAELYILLMKGLAEAFVEGLQ